MSATLCLCAGAPFVVLMIAIGLALNKINEVKYKELINLFLVLNSLLCCTEQRSHSKLIKMQ